MLLVRGIRLPLTVCAPEQEATARSGSPPKSAPPTLTTTAALAFRPARAW